MRNEYRYFLESNIVEDNIIFWGFFVFVVFFFLVDLNKDKDIKRFQTQEYYLPKGIIRNYSSITNRKDVYNLPIGSSIK